MVRGYGNAKDASARMRSNKTSNVLANAWARRGESGAPSASAAAAAAASATATTVAQPQQDQAVPPPPPPPTSGPVEGTIVEGITPTTKPTDSASPWTTLSEAFLSRTRQLRFNGNEASEEPANDEDSDDEASQKGQDVSEATSTTYSDELLGDVQSTADLEEGEKGEEPPQHLVFCIHGIGQKLSEDYNAAHFVHDIERLRATLRQQAQHPAMTPQLSNARVKLVPICWRHNMDFEPEHGQYNLRDITNDATIPAVRTMIAKVLLDIPFYLSNHRAAILRAVLLEANRLYRLFLQRNPDFESRGGKVSLLGHSLGSALASDLLAVQPTHVPPLHTRDAPGIHVSSKELLFNVEHFFCVGSPLPLLFYLNGSRLVARRRTESENPYQTQDDVTSDEIGKQGCLAAQQVHNVRGSLTPDLCRDGPCEFPDFGDSRRAVCAPNASRRGPS